MEVILSQDVEKLGKAGSIVKVKDGFARNYLFPRGLAVSKTAQNLEKLQQQKQNKELQAQKAKKEAEELSGKLANLSVTLSVLAEDEKLYGSIAAQDIAAALKDEGFDIDKSLILMDEPIKATGIYDIAIKLHPEITAKIKVWVVKK